MTACCSVVGNRDVEPFVPTLISCMGNPAEVAEGIHKLGAITFVQVLSYMYSMVAGQTMAAEFSCACHHTRPSCLARLKDKPPPYGRHWVPRVKGDSSGGARLCCAAAMVGMATSSAKLVA